MGYNPDCADCTDIDRPKALIIPPKDPPTGGLPAGGEPGQVLSIDDSGNPAWVTGGGGGGSVTLYNTTGQSATGGMTQKAITDALDGKATTASVEAVQTAVASKADESDVETALEGKASTGDVAALQTALAAKQNTLVQGDNVTLTALADGRVRIDAAGGSSGGGVNVALSWDEDNRSLKMKVGEDPDQNEPLTGVAMLTDLEGLSGVPEVQANGNWRYRLYDDNTYEAWYKATGQAIPIKFTSGYFYRSDPLIVDIPGAIGSTEIIWAKVECFHSGFPVMTGLESLPTGNRFTWYAVSGGDRGTTGNYTVMAHVFGTRA